MPTSVSAPLVVVAGDVINDILVRPVSAVTRGSDTTSVISARPGGSAANQAAWLGHLGSDVLFAGRCGARDADYHRGELARFGVDVRLAADGETGTGTIVIMVSPDGERTMFTDRGANLRLRRSDVPLPPEAACLHLTGYTFFEPSLLPVARSLIEDARSRGMAVTIDPGSAAYLESLRSGESSRGRRVRRYSSRTSTRRPCSPGNPTRLPWPSDLPVCTRSSRSSSVPTVAC